MAHPARAVLPLLGMTPDMLRDLAILVVTPTDVGALFEIAEQLDAQTFIDAERFVRAAGRFRVALIAAPYPDLLTLLRRARGAAPETRLVALLPIEAAHAEPLLRSVGVVHVAQGRVDPLVLREIVARTRLPESTQHA